MSYVQISPKKSTDRGGYICMPLKRNVPAGHPDWELVKCPECGEECWKDPRVEMLEKTGAVAICTMCALKKGAGG